jgi:hypothetical protein
VPKSELVDLVLEVHRETDKAYLVSDDGNVDNAVWLPKSQVETIPGPRTKTFEFTMPVWLAKEKHLV